MQVFRSKKLLSDLKWDRYWDFSFQRLVAFYIFNRHFSFVRIGRLNEIATFKVCNGLWLHKNTNINPFTNGIKRIVSVLKSTCDCVVFKRTYLNLTHVLKSMDTQSRFSTILERDTFGDFLFAFMYKPFGKASLLNRKDVLPREQKYFPSKQTPTDYRGLQNYNRGDAFETISFLLQIQMSRYNSLLKLS